jgi:hypothetical protein
MTPNGLFENSVVRISQCQELTSFLIPWLVIASPPLNNIPEGRGIPPAISTVIYALLEPLFTLLLYRTALAPWLILMCFSLIGYLIACCVSMELYRALRAKEHKVLTIVAHEKLEDRIPLNRLERMWISFLQMVPIASAALINAAFLLFTQGSEATSRLEQADKFPTRGLWKGCPSSTVLFPTLGWDYYGDISAKAALEVTESCLKQFLSRVS